MRSLWGAVGVCLVLAVLFVGSYFLIRGPKKKERSKMTDADVALYRRSARLLYRLIHITDMEGDFAGDILSPGTRKDIEAWLGDYKKELDKNAA